ncbi:hypothetical protein O0I10_000885 [Lichtheimia ornata]|uniref:Bromo domain-containing protein n=1 Tax=Lichtheimia ornata TaxID=688661 RepID=A0AAD7Y4H4_9FUNG|nr:uncharacterized protein O0I10_000885 [Lichtheimia ornata]KAJ8663637.1 hypothetical protein O0I10_000885 [Lichtheimia ornata]
MLALGNSVLLSTAHSMDMQHTTQPANTDQPPAENAIMSPRDKQFCNNLLKSLKKNPHALPFLVAVDPVALNCPDYPDIVKNPMDLGTIQTKLHSDQYDSIDAFANDIQLMFNNCYLYNGPYDPVTLEGRKLEEAYRRGMEKRPIPIQAAGELMPDDEFKRCEKTLKELKKPKHLEDAWIFLKPVDAGAWGAVDYYDIIKTPMDLSTMEKKLLEYEYANEQEFVNDMHLMFQNCYTYNPPGHPVHQSGKNLEATFEAYWEKLHEKKEKKKSSASKSSKGLKRDIAPIDSIPPQPKRAREDVEELDPSKEPKSSVLRLRIPTASLKQNQPPPQSTTTPTSASSVPASNNNNQLHLAISKHPPASQSASSSSATASTTTNTKRLALSDTKLSTPTKSNAPPLALSAQRKPKITNATARPHEANKGVPNKVANKLPSKPVPKKPAPQAFDVGVLLDGIAQEKEQREREKRLQQEQQQRLEDEKREKEMRRRQEEELRRQEWRDWATKKKESDRSKRMAALEASPINISRDKLRFHKFEKELSKSRDWHQLYGFQRDALQYHRYPMPGFVRNSQRSISDVKAMLLNATFRHRRQDEQMHHEDSVQDMDMDLE